MNGLNGITGGFSSITNGTAASESAKLSNETSRFEALLQSMTSTEEKVASSRLNGDYTTGFAGTYTSEADKHAKPQGAAAIAGSASADKTIDRTSSLYESALELESYFVKMMLSSMKSTLSGTSISGDKSFATGMYEDMLYDEIAVSMTKNAGFGLADQIYLELA